MLGGGRLRRQGNKTEIWHICIVNLRKTQAAPRDDALLDSY